MVGCCVRVLLFAFFGLCGVSIGYEDLFSMGRFALFPLPEPSPRRPSLASHDIVITNIVWCMAYKGGAGGGGGYIAQWACKSIAIG